MPRQPQHAAVALWSGTVSLPVADRDDAHIEEFKAFQPKLHAFCLATFQRCIYQLEKTEPDNWHYQLFFKTERTRRRVYELEDGLIISCTPASTAGIQALAKYAMKAATRQAGPWTCEPETAQQRMHKLWLASQPPLRPWQATAMKYILEHRSDRQIIWYSDPIGAAGKTTLAKHLAALHGAAFFSFADARSILDVAAKYLELHPCEHIGQRIMIFDLSKSKPKDTAWQDIYSALESIKNGFFTTSKGMDMKSVFCFSPTVVVFANQEPMVSAMAQDRFSVVPVSTAPFLSSGAG